MKSQVETRLETQAYPVDTLVALVREGAIRIPSFQRGLRWSKRDVQRLFDSIVHGYPIGNLLLWRRPATQARDLKIGALRVSSQERDQALFVVDGQQRLTSLASALSKEGLSDPLFALSYDVKRKEFVKYNPYGPPFEIPLPTLFELGELLQWFSQRPELTGDVALLDAATSAAKAIREFRVPVYIVDAGDPDVLRDIFDRMNNYGKQLTRAEVFSALHEVESGEKAEESTSEFFVIAERLHAATGFGMLDEDTVFLGFLARRGPEVSRDIRREFAEVTNSSRGGPDGAYTDELPSEAYEKTLDALIRAVEFVQGVAHVPHFALLPYRYLLVVLTRFFGYYPTLDPASQRNLRRWFWRAAIRGPEFFKGSSTGAVRTLSTKVIANDLQGSIDGLLATVSGPRPQAYPSIKQFKTNYSATRLLLNAMWERGPRPLTGSAHERYQTAALLAALGEDSSAADLSVMLYRGGLIDAPLRGGPGNRLFLPVAGSRVPDDPLEVVQYLARMTREPQSRARDILASHFIEDASLERLLAGDARGFLARRTATLHRALGSYLDRQAEWEFEDTPLLDSLLIDEVDSTDEPEARDDEVRGGFDSASLF